MVDEAVMKGKRLPQDGEQAHGESGGGGTGGGDGGGGGGGRGCCSGECGHTLQVTVRSVREGASRVYVLVPQNSELELGPGRGMRDLDNPSTCLAACGNGPSRLHMDGLVEQSG